MSTTDVTSPNESHRCTSPLAQAIEAATQQGARAIRSANQPREWELIAPRECPTPDQLQDCSTPQQAADDWLLHVQTNLYFDPDRVFFVDLILDTRRRVKGHVIVGMGILDSVLVHAREVFRVAIVAGAHAVIPAHNHPTPRFARRDPLEGDLRML